ncbi:cytochrome b5-related protein-like isoform X1 [Sipha flava]|uniref:Cytochrome b5-related protein-like isoform X1 n=3 Tax=Sipha flava TaxID=143950 RepID=A0A8B8GR13_9HEMI|nr:cytochrome b5-related protein-like isoform X1 [Sipha flava]
MAPRTSSWPAWTNISSTDSCIKSADDWIEAHRKEDGADGLWRIHDGLYDLRRWINLHPGGPQWLEMTRGTDVTELFETYHVNAEAAARPLRNYYVRRATSPRTSPFTFEPDGFYNVLRSRVATELRSTGNGRAKSALVVDTCFLVALVLCVAVARTQHYTSALAAGVTLALGTVASHNFTHLADNWRMYYMELSFLSVREWRISHVLSHHVFTNTVQDLEMTLFYPFLHWFPTDDKPFTVRWAPYLTPVVYPFVLPGQFFIRTFKRKNDITNFLIFVIPTILFFCGSTTITIMCVCKLWLTMILTSSFVFTFLGLSVSHHFPNNFHDGDYVSTERIDWGLHQMETSAERNELIDNFFITMVTFGDHTLHHLFPSLDHSVILNLQDTFKYTCEEFGLDLTQKPFTTIVRGQFKQLVRITPKNPKKK